MGEIFWVKSNGLYCTCPFPCTKMYQDIAEKYQDITGETSHLLKKYQEIRGETTHLLYRGSPSSSKWAWCEEEMTPIF